MNSYTFSIESLPAIYPEMESLCREHYSAMQDRLAEEGIPISDYRPRLDEYFKASNAGWLKTFVVRSDGAIVGYSNIYVTNDMHNGDLIAQEDMIYVTPSHRNGLGRKLTKFVLAELERLGVKRLCVTAVTDTRASILWKRLGFKETAVAMVYNFEAA